MKSAKVKGAGSGAVKAADATADVLDPQMPLKNYVSGIVLYTLGYFITTVSPVLVDRMNSSKLDFRGDATPLQRAVSQVLEVIGRTPAEGLRTIFYFYLARVTLELAFAPGGIRRPGSPYKFWRAWGKILANNADFLRGVPKVSAERGYDKDDLTNLLYFGVKFFYLPLMLSALYGNIGIMFTNMFGFPGAKPDTTPERLYFAILYTIFMFDVCVYTFGYLCELPGGKVRSVEPTALGWAVALACYPPFNDLLAKFMPYQIPEYNTFGSATWVVLSVTLILYVIYALASVALGLRASNLTNRGIVSWGPYRVVRHPAYITKNTCWLIMTLPAICQFNLTSLAALFAILYAFFLYWMRALTEERHLLQDPDYVAYCQKVKYRFIPGVY